jgi:hypothetical protein
MMVCGILVLHVLIPTSPPEFAYLTVGKESREPMTGQRGYCYYCKNITRAVRGRTIQRAFILPESARNSHSYREWNCQDIIVFIIVSY